MNMSEQVTAGIFVENMWFFIPLETMAAFSFQESYMKKWTLTDIFNTIRIIKVDNLTSDNSALLDVFWKARWEDKW